MRGAATYGTVFTSDPRGVGVTLTVRDLAATITQPFGDPTRLDPSAVRGALVFSLDRRGNATVTSTPAVSVAASRMISGLTTAQTFFPGLPDRAVTTGDEWVDTIAYEGDAEAGAVRERSVIRYTVAGDTTVAGRSLLRITLAGRTELSNEIDMGGMQISQSSTVDVEGHVLWDVQRGLMFEMVKSGSGRGTVNVPISPQPLPIQVRVTQRARLQGA
jgi:hypothetical protein